jgi:peptide/nickel transport system permease protein
MPALIARRLALGVLTLLAVSILIFAGTELLPGDLATAVLGQSATPETTEAIRRALRLNDPAALRYLRWLWSTIHGDLGTSLTNGRPIAAQLGFRLLNTFSLAGLVAIVAVPLAIGLGIITAIKENKFFDRMANVVSLSMISIPEFFIGYCLILIVAVRLDLLPSFSSITPEMGFLEKLRAMALPATTLVMVVLAHMMRMTRAAILMVLASSFVETALLKGLPKWRVVVKHALPNAVGPIANVVGLNLAYVIVGVVVVEVVFVYPGMGQMMVDAVAQRNVPVVQACGLIFASTYVLINLAADVLAIASNPRLRYPK